MDASKISPRDIIILGCIAGITIQLVKFAAERYEEIWPFVKAYPGLTIAGLSAVIGLSLMYGRPLIAMFRNSSSVKK